MNRFKLSPDGFKLSLVAAALAALACLAACGNDAPSNTAANTSNASNASNANAAARATPAANAAAAPASDEFASARADYQNYCVKCHKEDGTGGPVELDDGEKVKVPNFRAEKHTEEQFAKKIANGDPDEGMPAFKNRLDQARIAALARFILREFPAGSAVSGPNANAAKPAPPAH